MSTINTFVLQSISFGGVSSLEWNKFWTFLAWRFFVLLNPFKRSTNSWTVKSAYSLMPTVKVCTPSAASWLCWAMKAKFFSKVKRRVALKIEKDVSNHLKYFFLYYKFVKIHKYNLIWKLFLAFQIKIYELALKN